MSTNNIRFCNHKNITMVEKKVQHTYIHMYIYNTKMFHLNEVDKVKEKVVTQNDEQLS